MRATPIKCRFHNSGVAEHRLKCPKRYKSNAFHTPLHLLALEMSAMINYIYRTFIMWFTISFAFRFYWENIYVRREKLLQQQLNWGIVFCFGDIYSIMRYKITFDYWIYVVSANYSNLFSQKIRIWQTLAHSQNNIQQMFHLRNSILGKQCDKLCLNRWNDGNENVHFSRRCNCSLNCLECNQKFLYIKKTHPILA